MKRSEPLIRVSEKVPFALPSFLDFHHACVRRRRPCYLGNQGTRVCLRPAQALPLPRLHSPLSSFFSRKRAGKAKLHQVEDPYLIENLKSDVTPSQLLKSSTVSENSRQARVQLTHFTFLRPVIGSFGLQSCAPVSFSLGGRLRGSFLPPGNWMRGSRGISIADFQ